MKRSHLRIMAPAAALLMLLSACGQSTNSSYPAQAAGAKNEAAMEDRVQSPAGLDGAAPESAPDTEAAQPLSPQENVKLIWRAELELETLELDPLIEQLIRSVQEHGGFVESSERYGGQRLSGRRTSRGASYTVRIPSDRLEDFLSQAGTLGSVVRQNKWSENVTLDYADNEARRDTLLLEEQKLKELLRQATQLSDVIQLEARLSELHYQLDGYSAALRRYDDLIDYGTVTLYLTEVEHVANPAARGFGERVSDLFSQSLYGIRAFGQGLAVFLLGASPILVLAALAVALIVLLLRRIIRRSRRAAGRPSDLSYDNAPPHRPAENPTENPAEAPAENPAEDQDKDGSEPR